MSKAREKLAARAAAIAGPRSAPAPEAESVSTESSSSVPTEPPAASRSGPVKAPRSTPVRITVDLAPVEYRRLKRWADDAADDLELPRVPGAEVVRVLLELLTSNDDAKRFPGLAERVQAELVRRTQ